MLVFAGLAVLPFRWSLPVPRDPVPVDALPDISENQQVVFTEWPGRSPQDVEDQVTYPLATALLGIPGVKSVRSTSMFGFSSIYVIFEDDVEFYWSRSRVLEKLASLPAGTLPPGVAPMLGPDATALGQVFWYTLEPLDEEGEPVPGVFDLDELRSIQDWHVRYALQSVQGVSEVASVGGHVREYQVDVDPDALRAHQVTIQQVARAVGRSNLDVGARTIEISGAEYVVRGLGFVRSLADLEEAVVAVRDHTPIRVRDVGVVSFGPALRRGALDKNGAEVVGGVVVVRYGDNPMAVIDRVKDKIEDVAVGLPSRTAPDGRVAKVTIVPFYDRSVLIEETLDTLSDALVQQILITVVVVLVLLRHMRSSILISALLPLSVLGTFVVMKVWGVAGNIMAISGIAIAIGTMVDMGIVFTENMVRRIEEAPEDEPVRRTVVLSTAEVAGAVGTSVATTVLGFVPVFDLEGSEGKLFVPLAYTKTFALVVAFLLAVVVLPSLGVAVLRRKRPRAGRVRWLAADGFDVALMAVGGLLVRTGLWPAGLVVASLGVFGAVESKLPPKGRRYAGPAVYLAAVAVVLGYLAGAWMPLGHGEDYVHNYVFVAGVFAVPMVVLWGFGALYEPILRWALRRAGLFLLANVAFVLAGVLAWLGPRPIAERLPAWVRETAVVESAVDAVEAVFPGLEDDFLPPFDEGTFLFMPQTTPHASIGTALEMLRLVDARIEAIPEVRNAVGKLGRAESPLDPAPIAMFEIVVDYEPEYRIGSDGKVGRFRYDEAAEAFARDEHGNLIEDPDGRPYRNWRPHIRTPDDIWKEVVEASKIPGLSSSPKLAPIKTRIVMLQTGMRSSIGIKVRGSDLATIEGFGLELEALLRQVPEVAGSTVVADRIVGKPYLEIELDRAAIARYGVNVEDVQEVLQIAVGGKVLSRSVEGRERYPIRVRYMREERGDVESLERLLVAGAGGEQVPLGQLATIRYVRGPQSIRSEDTFLTSYVTFDPAEGVGEVAAAEAARRAIEAAVAEGRLAIPPGVSYRLAGTYENQVRAARRLSILVPMALAVIFVLLYLQFGTIPVALIVFTGAALAAAGGFLLLWAYGRPGFLDVEVFGHDLAAIFSVGPMRLTVAVWTGFLALFGVATDNGVVVATYLTQRFRLGTPKDRAELHDWVVEAAQRRVRPCLLTTATTLIALLPVVTSHGRGADLMIPMALPSVGGVLLSVVTLLTVPVLFTVVERRRIAG
ncbi:MAG: efflux RND transporter permease subunit [Deltaproteobacteria bacterium]|nr:MAG: efflux RND transporter permease subunit [Deltaproteobacteria bacterium]